MSAEEPHPSIELLVNEFGTNDRVITLKNSIAPKQPEQDG